MFGMISKENEELVILRPILCIMYFETCIMYYETCIMYHETYINYYETCIMVE